MQQKAQEADSCAPVLELGAGHKGGRWRSRQAEAGVFERGKGVCLCPIRVSALKRLSRGGKWRLVTQRCVITETALE